ncbi:MAG: AtpZ/AtpI family protein [Bacteroidales bacterium]|nr:AtpZ/AtpI family protein [Bacteroidales bacterium]
MSRQSSPERRKTRTQNRLNAYAKYSSLAVQMMAIIAAGTYGGFRLDRYLDRKFPLFTVVCSLLSVGVAIWHSVKDLLKK